MPTGLTRDVGWEIGVSRTMPVPLEEVWAFITSPGGAALWLGAGAVLPQDKGTPVSSAEGAGELRSFRPLDRFRLTWRSNGSDPDTTIQVAVRGDQTKTMLRFHQEHLADEEERNTQRTH